ncbi:MAG TPA: PEGA domain-containing protein [Polyangia bacterium]|nr:PEGA domain-containing protein [Polyangia bacterium]
MRLWLLYAFAAFQASPHPSPAASARTSRPIALFRIDPLGLDAEIVARLEALLRAELERIVGSGMPTPREIARVTGAEGRLANCAGESDCLAAVGRALGAQLVVAGNVGGLAESYVINLKIVDARAGTEVRRVSQALHGDPDVLIEEIRVAAYRLVAPEKVKGSLAILTDARGARIFLDGQPIGATPVVGAISNLQVGDHSLRIARDGYADFLRPITIRFQKTTQVIVRMEELPGAEAAALRQHDVPVEPVRFYGRWWFYAIVGAVAVGAGVTAGLLLTSPHQVNCGAAGCP